MPSLLPEIKVLATSAWKSRGTKTPATVFWIVLPIMGALEPWTTRIPMPLFVIVFGLAAVSESALNPILAVKASLT